MSSSTCSFLTSIQVSQEAGKAVWYSHLLNNFPQFVEFVFHNLSQFVVIHTIKRNSVVKEAKIDIFLEFSCFLYGPMDVGNLISGSSAKEIKTAEKNINNLSINNKKYK